MTDPKPVEYIPDQDFPIDDDAVALQALFSRATCIHNDKGGVGKSSLAVNLAGILAEANYHVLLVDTDPQGNCADLLGVGNKTDRGRAFQEHILKGEQTTPLPTVEARPRLDLVVGGSWLRRVTAQEWERLNGRPINPYYLLLDPLATIAEEYDLIIIDTPPGESDHLWGALGASHRLIIPTHDDVPSIRGLETVVTRFELALRYNPHLQAIGTLLTHVPSTATRMDRKSRDLLTQVIGADLLFDAPLRYAYNASVLSSRAGRLAHELAADTEAIDVFAYLRQGKPVPDRAQSAPGLAMDYFRIADELLRRLHDLETAEENAS